MASEMTYKPLTMTNDQMESARIKSELASYIVSSCLRDLNMADPAGALELQRSNGMLDLAIYCVRILTNILHLSSGSAGAGSNAATSNTAALPNQLGDTFKDTISSSAPSEAIAALKQALGMKDDLISALQHELNESSAARKRLEDRVGDLDKQINQQRHQMAQQQQQSSSVMRPNHQSNPPLSPHPASSIDTVSVGSWQQGPLLGPIALVALSSNRPASAGPTSMLSASTAVPLPNHKVPYFTSSRQLLLDGRTAGGSMPTLSSLDNPLDSIATAVVSKTSALREHSRFSDQIMAADCDSALSLNHNLQDSMVAGAMDELIMAQGAMMEIPMESSVGYESQMSQPGIHCAFQIPTYGSLPFATSLPRTLYSNAAIPSSANGSEGNPLLASVLRAAGDAPEALPGADLRQRHANN